MPQRTNFNVSPYFDDFDADNNYYKVLFKPGYPIQARELNNLQSIAQNQTEQFGNHIFKEGSVVIPGQMRYDNRLYAIQIEPTFNGLPISLYFDSLLGAKIRGSINGVTAEVVFLLNESESERGNYTLYLKYIESGGENFDIKVFVDGETLILDTPISYGNTTIQAGQSFCNTISTNAAAEGTSVFVADGVYFVRGIFANVKAQRILLDQYGIIPSYKVGFDIVESIVNSDQDSTLVDNSQGFSNYAAPGADRFKFDLVLSKKTLDDVDTDYFVEILRVVDGQLIFARTNTQYSLIRDELARRTFDESGNYIVKPFTLFARDSLNDRLSLNPGIFYDNQRTPQGNIPSEDLMVYQIGPGKAYINGYDAETISSTLVDIPKSRTTETKNNQYVPYNAGSLVIVNNSYGSPYIGVGTDTVVSLMDSRIGTSASVATGTTIGYARVYDFVPESDYIDDTSRLNLRLFDIQTITKIGLTTSFASGLSTPCFVEGKRSKATGYLKTSVSAGSTILTLYETTGNFLENEQIILNGVDDGRLIKSVTDYSTSDIKSIYSSVGFNADLVLSNKSYIASPGTTFKIDNGVVSAGLGSVFTNVVKPGDIVSYANTNFTGDPIYNKVVSVGSGGTSFTITGITTVSGICNGILPSGSFNASNIFKISAPINSFNSSFLTPLKNTDIESVNLEGNEVLQRRSYSVSSFSGNTLSILIDPVDVDVYFASFDEDRFMIVYSDGSVEPMRSDKYNLSLDGKTLTFNGLGTASGTNAKVIATVRNLKANNKTKKLNKVSTLVVSNSQLVSSGIGTTTSNDGLSYSAVYGTRVQDKEISLNVPDVARVLAVYESTGTNDPSLPTIQISGNPSGNSNFIVGEQIIGKTSGSVGLITRKVDSDKLEYVYLNTLQFSDGEVISGKESTEEAIVINRIFGDKNITNIFTFDDGQRRTFYDYSRIVRVKEFDAPKRKIKIVFQNYTIDSTDSGEIITANSYPKDEYKFISRYSGIKLNDYIDLRPRVSPYTISSKSPFEFDSRNFAGDGQYSKYVLVPGENLVLSYSYYVGRIDRVFLNSNGTFEVSQGVPSSIPIPPPLKSNLLDIATITVPPYVYDLRDVKVEMSRYKRYRMSDITLLEDRIKRIEEYTTLNTLESKTENLNIKDAATGLDRFKSGFFVDNFSTYINQDTANLSYNARIQNNALLCSENTNSLDLQLGSEIISGFTTSYIPERDPSYVVDLGSPGIRKTGDLITLNYNNVLYDEQVYATKSESVTPFLQRYWQGFLTLNPPEDSWFDQRTVIINSFVENIERIQRENINTVNENSIFVPTPTSSGGAGGGGVSGGGNGGGTIDSAPIGNTNTPFSRGNLVNIFALRSLGLTFPPLSLSAALSTPLVNGRSQTTFDPTGPGQAGVRVNISQGDGGVKSIRLVGILPRPTSPLPENPPGEPQGPVSGGGGGGAPTSTSVTNTVTIPEEIISRDTVSESISEYTESIRFLRSRNIEFDAKALKPVTRFYAFFEGIDISKYIIPKLIEIEMLSGKFQIGEVVESDPLSSVNSKIVFRACKPNHKTGPFDGSNPPIVQNPSTPVLNFSTGNRVPTLIPPPPGPDIFKLNPYTQQPIESTYTESSTILNVDTLGLQLPTTEFYGFIESNMILVGRTSGARARIKNVRLISDNSGRLIGSFYIPNASTSENPRWTNGENTFILIDTPQLSNLNLVFDEFISNSRINESSAEAEFSSSATTFVKQIDILTTRNTRVLSSYNINTTTITNTIPDPIPSPITPTTPIPITPTPTTPTPTTPTPTTPTPPRTPTAIPTRRPPIQVIAGGGGGLGDRDPLAQSFFVSDPNGIFLTAIDLFFETKDETLPVILQIRPLIAGVPSNVIIPFSELVINPDDINLSTDASVPTTIAFKSPIYLQGPSNQQVRGGSTETKAGVEYAIVLLSDSPNYRVFISELGKFDLQTKERVSIQPTLGSLFKSQNGSTWNPAQLEDLKYRIYRADFVNEGLVRFFNPDLSLANGKVNVSPSNSLLPLSKRVVVGLGSTGFDGTNISRGVTIVQGSASGKLIGIAGSITVGSGVTISNAGIGYTNGTFTGVSLESETGYGTGAVATIGVVNSGIASVTITSPGLGYQVGDSLIIPEKEYGLNVGFGGKLTVTSVSNNNTFVLDNVQGSFSVGITSLSVITSTGTTVSTGATISSITPDAYYDGLHMKIIHPNHGMHSTENYVKISGIRPLKSEVNSKILQDVSFDTTIFTLESTSGFEIFEGVAVSVSNPGYALIGGEIVEYTGVSGGSLQISERSYSFIEAGIFDGSLVSGGYSAGTRIYKYEFNGVSLRRINKTHNFAEVDVENHPIELNSYFIKIDNSDTDFDNVGIGSNRPDLYFKETTQTGEPGAVITQNIQFESLIPNIANIIPGQTTMSGRVRTFTGTSISGSENSFEDAGFKDIDLVGETLFDSPMLVCSKINEQRLITESPGNKSFTMELLMSTNDSKVSPVIDLIRTNVILSTNLINAPVGVNETSNYADDDTVRSLDEDKHSAIYISNPVRLQLPANSLKVLLTVSRDLDSDVRVLYQLFRDDSPELSQNYELFPGYSNYQVDSQGIKRVTDKSRNDGSADSLVRQSNDRSFRDYEYSVDDLPDFTGFAIKIVMASKNQAKPPVIKNLRAIATVKPRI